MQLKYIIDIRSDTVVLQYPKWIWYTRCKWAVFEGDQGPYFNTHLKLLHQENSDWLNVDIDSLTWFDGVEIYQRYNTGDTAILQYSKWIWYIFWYVSELYLKVTRVHIFMHTNKHTPEALASKTKWLVLDLIVLKYMKGIRGDTAIPQYPKWIWYMRCKWAVFEGDQGPYFHICSHLCQVDCGGEAASEYKCENIS